MVIMQCLYTSSREKIMSMSSDTDATINDVTHYLVAQSQWCWCQLPRST